MTPAFIPVLAALNENPLDYSLQNTAQQALLLVTRRDAKYKAKGGIDTFATRSGDALSAGAVAVGGALSMTTGHFIWVDIGLAVMWVGIVVLLTRQHRRVAAQVKGDIQHAGVAK